MRGAGHLLVRLAVTSFQFLSRCTRKVVQMLVSLVMKVRLANTDPCRKFSVAGNLLTSVGKNAPTSWFVLEESP